MLDCQFVLELCVLDVVFDGSHYVGGIGTMIFDSRVDGGMNLSLSLVIEKKKNSKAETCT